jgi:hypothetical protein
MKTVTAFLLLAALLCGCQKSDPQIAKMEIQITLLESNVANLDGQANRRWMDATNEKAIDMQLLEMEQTNNDVYEQLNIMLVTHEVEIETLQNQMTNLSLRIPIHSVQSATKTVASPQGNKVPEDVLAQIRADAEKQFPNDYDEQVFIINEQVTAWRKLNP